MKKQKWEGQLEKVQMEYTISAGEHNPVVTGPMNIMVVSNEIPIDKTDCLIAASSGILTAMLDILWVGEFSLRYAQDVGTEQINNLVISIAKRDSISKGKRCPKDDLKSCIRYLEKEYPLASDKLTNEFGNSLNHHLRDFSHHASPFGLICSILNQFTKRGYGTDTDGRFIRPEIPATDTIGETFEEKITLGVVDWFYHLVSDMAGSSSSAGRGTGIPGPILSMAKVLSATPLFRELKIRYKDDVVGFSVWVSKLFNGTAFEHTSHKDIIRFDLRTEIGIGNFAVKQSIPVLLNQCIVRAFYFMRRLALDFTEKKIDSLSKIQTLEASKFLPFNNRTTTHMITISTGVFSVIDGADAIIRAKIKNPHDSAKMLSNTLLRLNFVGIGAFAISIKNEIKYTVQDVKGILGRKTKAQQLLDEKAAQSKSVEYIDIEVDMDNRNLYEYTFAELSNMVVLSREKLLANHAEIESSIGRMFSLGDENYSAHKSIVEANESRCIRYIETLVVKICEQNNIPFEYYPVDARFSNCRFDVQAASRPFQMVRIEESKRVGYVFCDAESVCNYVGAFATGNYEVDAIKIVRLNAPDQSAYESFYEAPNKQYAASGICARVITIAELFDSLFGKDEYAVFVEYVNAFNAKVKELIGFNTVLAPTDEAISRFKVKTGEALANYPYKNYIPEDVFQSQVKILLDNYLNRKLWRAMIGTSDFAASFISSEWNYHVYQLTDNLDMTGLVSGYLKSVEQLLHNILQISASKGISIKARDGRIVEYAIENEQQIDLTLGSLEAAIQHNGHILDVSPYMKRYLVDTISDWRDKQRNGYFHKHNLYSAEKVAEIRDKAIYLYFLILGSCTISDNQFSKLGIAEETGKQAFSYKAFVSWLEPILNYGLPKDTVAVRFVLYDTSDEKWSVQLCGLKTFDESIPSYKWKENFSSGHNLYKWDRTLQEEETVHAISEAVREYLANGIHKNKLSIYQAVSVESRFHTEYPYKNK